MVRNRFLHFARLPSWASEVFDGLKEIAKFYFVSKTATPQMGRLKGGFLIKQILDDFYKKPKSKDRHRFIMYSAHDDTIVNVLNTLGLYDVGFENNFVIYIYS